MSIVRYSQNSDVYLYEHVGGFIVCQECKLGGNQNFDRGKTYPGVRLFSYLDAYGHLSCHKAAGHKVPDGVIESLKYSADAGFAIAVSFCDVPDCGQFSECSYPTLIAGNNVPRETCRKHYDADGAKAYQDWLKSEHRRLGKIP